VGLKEKVKNLTAREESKEISKGETKEKHLGKYTPVMIEHYIMSLKITDEAHRDKEWEKLYNEILAEIQGQLQMPRNQRTYSGLLSRLRNVKQTVEI